MKRPFIILILLLVTTNLSNAQPYQSIFASGDGKTKWVFIWHNLSISVNDTAYIEKDTIVNGIAYKKIATIGQDYGGAGGWLIRENTDSGHVWFRSIKLRDPQLDDTTEQLAFRYDLNVGDTFDISNSQLSSGSYPDSFNVVDSIRYVGGLKYIYFKGKYSYYNDEPFTIIEGIGSNMGILWKHMSPTAMRFQYLLCSYKSGQKTSYINRHFNGACWIYSDIESVDEKYQSINLYPQPAKRTVWIENKTDQKINRINVISQTGKLVKEVTAPVITSLEIEEIPAGFYYLMMYTATGYLTTKPMVTR